MVMGLLNLAVRERRRQSQAVHADAAQSSALTCALMAVETSMLVRPPPESKQACPCQPAPAPKPWPTRLASGKAYSATALTAGSSG
jgi:hypothetical protein